MRDSRVALLLLALAQPAAAQWTYASSGTTAERGLSIASSDGTIWSSGARGTVVRSHDGGRTWQTDTVGGAATLDLRAVHGFSAVRAVVPSAGEDRGRTWSVTDTPGHAEGGAAGIFSLAFFEDRIGIAAGGDYTKPRLSANSVALTTDGGWTWMTAAAPPPAYLSGVSYAGRPGSSSPSNSRAPSCRVMAVSAGRKPTPLQ